MNLSIQHNKLREYKGQLKDIRVQLKKNEDEAQKNKRGNLDTMNHFQKKVEDLRARNKTGEKEMSVLRTENKEIKVLISLFKAANE